MFDNLGVSLPLVQGGKLKLLGVATPKRMAVAAGRADDRGDAAGLRVGRLVRGGRAAQDAASDRRQDQRRHQRGAARAGGGQAPGRHVGGDRRRHAGGDRRTTSATRSSAGTRSSRPPTSSWSSAAGAARMTCPADTAMARRRAWRACRTGSIRTATCSTTEQERIFRGPTWNFLCLEAELPKPNTLSHARASARCRWWSRATPTASSTPSRTAARIAARCSCINERGEAQRHRLRLSQLELRPCRQPHRRRVPQGHGRQGRHAGRRAARRESAAQAAGRDARRAWSSARCRHETPPLEALSRPGDRQGHPPRDARAGAACSAATARCCRATGSSTWRT